MGIPFPVPLTRHGFSQIDSMVFSDDKTWMRSGGLRLQHVGIERRGASSLDKVRVSACIEHVVVVVFTFKELQKYLQYQV